MLKNRRELTSFEFDFPFAADKCQIASAAAESRMRYCKRHSMGSFEDRISQVRKIEYSLAF